MEWGNVIWIALAGIVGLIAGGAAVIVVERLLAKSRLEHAKMAIVKMHEEAETKTRQIELAAEKDALDTRNRAEAEVQRRLQELREEDERLHKRREVLDKRIDRLEDRERKLNQRQSRIDKMRNEIEALYAKQTAELERVANLSQEEAKELLLQDVETRTRDEMARVIRQVEAQAKQEADQRARKVITTAIPRGTTW